MISVWFWLLVSMVVLTIGFTLARPARVFEFPAFMGFTFGVFIVPQVISILRFPGAVPPSAVSAVLAMSCLCLAACLLGYQLKPRRTVQQWIASPVNEGRLAQVGLVFVGIGFFFGRLLANTDVQFSEQGGMTGIGTIYLFFGQLVFPGFAICVLTVLRQPNPFNLMAVMVAAWIPFQSIVNGRREPAAMVLLILGMGLYFQRRLTPPRWAIAAVAVIAMLAIPATGTYRGLQANKDWSGIRQIDLVDNFRNFLTDESILELRNAAILIENTRLSGAYQWGVGYWNHLVFRFIPAQIVGASLKQSLQIGVSGEDSEFASKVLDYENPIGSTVTGMGDSYQQFGWFGCLFFVLLAILFRSLWEVALHPQAIFAQLFYMVITTTAMRTVTHWTLDFLPGLVYFSIFLGLAYLYARAPRRTTTARPRRTRQQRPGGMAPARIVTPPLAAPKNQ